MKTFPNSLVKVAEDSIRNSIISGKLALGQKVTEQELAEQFNISKTPIREALQTLQREGLVEVRPRKGTFIFTFTEESITSLRGVRNALEQFALREAVRRDRTRLLRDIGENLQRSDILIEKNDIPSYTKIDREFHSFFFKYAQNLYLDKAYSAIGIHLQVLWRLAVDHLYQMDNVIKSVALHKTIANHILEDEIDQACESLAYHNNRISILNFPSII